MSVRFPISAKILLWFFLNLLVLGLVFYVFLQAQYHLGLDSLLMGKAGERLQVMADVVGRELDKSPHEDWNGLLEQFSRIYQVKLLLFRGDGAQVAGETTALPAEVTARLPLPKGPPPRRSMPPRAENDGERAGNGPPEGARGFGQPHFPPGPAVRPGRPPGEPGPQPPFMLRTSDPSRYWVGMRMRAADFPHLGPAPLTLIAASNSIRGGGMFFDFTPWIIVGFGCVLVSVLFWLPLVRGITRSISQITRATEQIAEGRFEARVAAARRDELGRLGQAINQMAARLAGFVSGQKRFLGDIAHELCSPIARLQMAIGILEQQADERQKPRLEDLREEVQEMSDLVNELLSFSKASLEPAALRLEPVPLLAAVEKAVNRESVGRVAVRVAVERELTVTADPEILVRALANLVRNAVRHAGHAGPITISARREGEEIWLSISDHGPGVPEAALQRIFDPFYRPDTSRNRETGGVGLGLAIVKSCVESCGGTVQCRNRQPSGLEVLVRLRRGGALTAEA